MTVKEFISAVATALGKSVSAIGKAIANANLAGLIRFGILIGVSISTIIVIFKFFKMKKEVYNDTSNKSVVDEALDLNYSDVRNQSKLDPLMKKVRKNLNKELKPRKKKHMKKKARKAQKKYYDYLKYGVERRGGVLEDDYDLMEDFDIFRKEMKDVSKKRKADKKRSRTIDDYNLRTVWENS